LIVLLAVKNITKRFPGVIALNDVSMELHRGKVNAIIGENGAGKSTLMKILSGVYCDYEGTIFYNDRPVSFTGVRDAQACGIAIIHQELNLVPYLSIRENIFLGREIETRWGLLDKKAMITKTRSLLQRLNLDIHPETLVSELKVGQQQVIEIAKALLTDSDVIIMDEPTSAISDKEVNVLFEIINDLKKENKTIVYISHKLDELFKIADRYVVMRDGCSIESGDMKQIDHDRLIEKMVGRQIQIVHRKNEGQANTEELFRVENICLRHPVKKDENILENISFHVNKGEIVGLFGLMGAGRTELMETLFGMHPRNASGNIYVNGKTVKLHLPSDAIKAGIALVPEDRKKNGLILGMDVRSNISLTTLNDLEQAGFLNNQKEGALSGKYVSELKIKTASDRQAAKNLSGGNQQKIVLAKWLAKKPKLLLLDEPTRGVDINAKNEIYKLILQLAVAGLGIIMVSSELPEILSVSDRILVLSEGSLTAEIPISEATENSILKAAISKLN
jgi:ribose transport system ATP-binding protein